MDHSKKETGGMVDVNANQFIRMIEDDLDFLDMGELSVNELTEEQLNSLEQHVTSKHASNSEMRHFYDQALLVLRKQREIEELGSLQSKPKETDSLIPPPMHANLLLSFCLSRTEREHILGDLEEEYRKYILPRFGFQKARMWYWWQVITSITPVIILRIGALVKLVWAIKGG